MSVNDNIGTRITLGFIGMGFIVGAALGFIYVLVFY